MSKPQKKLPKKQQAANLSGILSKELRWLMPYLEDIQDIVPFDRIKKISYYTKRKHHKKEHHKAITYRLGNNKNFNIVIRTKLPKAEQIPLRYWDQEDVLFYLAHEIAHVLVWEHTTNHFVLMSEIFNRFAQTLHRIGFEEERNK